MNAPEHFSSHDDTFLDVQIIARLDLIVIRGWSIDPNVGMAYDKVLDFIPGHLATNNELSIYFKYELFNPLTARYLFKIIMKLNQYYVQGKKVHIYWNNAEMMDELLDVGYDLHQLCDFEFRIS